MRAKPPLRFALSRPLPVPLAPHPLVGPSQPPFVFPRRWRFEVLHPSHTGFFRRRLFAPVQFCASPASGPIKAIVPDSLVSGKIGREPAAEFFRSTKERSAASRAASTRSL